MKPDRTAAGRALALLLVLALIATACGSDGDDDAAGDGGSDVAGEVAATESDGADDAVPGSGDEATEQPEDSGATGGTLRIGARADAQTFDTAGIGLGHFFQYWLPVYDTLLRLAPDGSLEPNLATDWSYDDDRTALTLSLQDGVTFTDGEVFNADAVKANLEYFRDSGGRFSVIAANVADVVVVDDLTVELQLSQPDPALLNGLSIVAGAMASPAILGTEGFATSPVGSGPYILDEEATSPGTEYVYARNPDYWNPDAYAYDSIVIKPLTDNQARLNAVVSGEVDTALLGVAANVATAEDAGLRIDTTPVNWHGLVIADRAGDVVPALADPLVRQALNMAFDKQAIVDNVQLGYGEPTSQVFGQNNAAWKADLADVYTYDPDRARELLADAGYPDGFSVPMPEGAAFQQINPIVAAQLADIGVTVEYEPVPPDSFISRLVAGDFPMFFMSLGSQSAAEDFNKLLKPSGSWNPSNYEDPELLAMIDDFAAASGDEQATIAQEVNQYVVDNAWFAPVYYEMTTLATDPSVGFTPHSQYVIPFIRDYYVVEE